MLYDREYMRAPDRHRVKAAVALLWILGGCFIIQAVLKVYGNTDLAGALGLSWAGVRSGCVWQLLTFQFLHAVPWPFHVLGNCLALYFFGRPVEERLGSRRFLVLYFGGGLCGGILELGVDLLLRRPDIWVVGASAGVSALIAAFCHLFPDREGRFILYFFPVQLRAMTFLWILTGLTVWGVLLPWDNVAHAAHLGGMAVGYFGVGALESEGWLAVWRERRARRTSSSRARSVRVVPPETAADFVSREVDPILDKIAAKGFQSLTKAEKSTLETARRRIDRR